MIERHITEDDLVRVFELDHMAEDLELMVKKWGRKPYTTGEDLAKIIGIAVRMHSAGIIMRRFLNNRTDVQVVVEKGKGFIQEP